MMQPTQPPRTSSKLIIKRKKVYYTAIYTSNRAVDLLTSVGGKGSLET